MFYCTFYFTCDRCLKVAWLDHHSIPLTYEERRVVDDSRFSVVRPDVKEWNLQVRDIHPLDEGQYRCTINTNPVKSKVVILHVKGTLVERSQTIHHSSRKRKKT